MHVSAPDGTSTDVTSVDNVGQATKVVPGDAEINEYTLTLTCSDDDALTDSIGFQVSYTPAPTLVPTSVPTSSPAPTRDTVSYEITLHTETTDASYESAEAYCSDYYAYRVDELEEAVVADYVDAVRQSTGHDDTLLAEIDALCSPNVTNATTQRVAATFSIRFVAYASSLFSGGGATVHTIEQKLEAFFQDKVDSGDWTADRLDHTTESSWTATSGRRLEDSAAAQDYITPQSVVSVETVVVETLNPTIAPSSRPSSPPSPSPSSAPTGPSRVCDSQDHHHVLKQRRCSDADAVERAVGAAVGAADAAAHDGIPNVDASFATDSDSFASPDQRTTDIEAVGEPDPAPNSRAFAAARQSQRQAHSGADDEAHDYQPELVANGHRLL